eukprot:227237-Prymnesium_polylepis.1
MGNIRVGIDLDRLRRVFCHLFCVVCADARHHQIKTNDFQLTVRRPPAPSLVQSAASLPSPPLTKLRNHRSPRFPSLAEDAVHQRKVVWDL